MSYMTWAAIRCDHVYRVGPGQLGLRRCTEEKISSDYSSVGLFRRHLAKEGWTSYGGLSDFCPKHTTQEGTPE